MKDGDFIRLDFDAFVKETDQLVDTTSEETAKEHDAFNERVRYGPIALIVGSGHVVKGLDQDLANAELGTERNIEVEPLEAFGERDPKMVETFPERKILSLPEFRKGDQYPMEGMEVRINNRIGFIAGRFAGRYRVDFNHRWAGKTITYKYTVKELIEDKADKLKAIIESAYGNPDDFNVELISDEEVEIVLPDMVKLDQAWTMAKFKLVSDLRAHLALKRIRLVEEYVKKEEQEGTEHEHECDDPNCDHDHHHEEKEEADSG